MRRAERKSEKEAKLWAATLDFAGYSDWRLPRTPGTITNGITTEGESRDVEVSVITTDTEDTTIAETTEPQSIQEYSRAKSKV